MGQYEAKDPEDEIGSSLVDFVSNNKFGMSEVNRYGTKIFLTAKAERRNYYKERSFWAVDLSC